MEIEKRYHGPQATKHELPTQKCNSQASHSKIPFFPSTLPEPFVAAGVSPCTGSEEGLEPWACATKCSHVRLCFRRCKETGFSSSATQQPTIAATNWSYTRSFTSLCTRRERCQPSAKQPSCLQRSHAARLYKLNRAMLSTRLCKTREVLPAACKETCLSKAARNSPVHFAESFRAKVLVVNNKMQSPSWS